MNTHQITTSSPDAAPDDFKYKATAFVALVTLLFIAGLTASVIGYQVKKAEWDRTGMLIRAYESLGGSRAALSDPRQTLLPAATSADARAFITAFELNERARAFGLYRTLENTPIERVAGLHSALEAVGAEEAAMLVRNTQAALAQATTPTAEGGAGKPISAEAARLSKRYDRNLARRTQFALFRFLHERLPDAEHGSRP